MCGRREGYALKNLNSIKFKMAKFEAIIDFNMDIIRKTEQDS